MPARATKRGDERTPLDGRRDVLICGASFAGLAIARELAGSGADVLVVDRYEIGERQTSACGIPTEYLRRLGLMECERQRFDSIIVHTPWREGRWRLPWPISTFDYREFCELLWSGCDAQFETAKVNGRAVGTEQGEIAVATDRGVISAPLVVDGLGWRRVLAERDGYQPPDAPLSRGLEVHPEGPGEDLEIWVNRRYVPAGYGWSFPAGDETRVGVGSFDPRFHVRATTELLAEDLGRDRVRYQGNWIPHKLRASAEGGVFFVGDSAGHCVPFTAEGIRTALYFGVVLGRELRGVVQGRQSRERAAASYAEFHASHGWKFRCMLWVQKLVPRLPKPALAIGTRALQSRRLSAWAFERYLKIAHPDLVGSAQDEKGPGQQQDHPDDTGRADRDLVQAE